MVRGTGGSFEIVVGWLYKSEKVNWIMRIRRGKSAEKLDTDKRNLKHIKENQVW